MLKFIALLIVASACGTSGKEAPPSAKETKPAGAAAAGAAGNVRWPKPRCGIIAADAVAAIVGKPVKEREQAAAGICDFLTGDQDGVAVTYYDLVGGHSEFAIFKGLQDERGGKHRPVSGLGAEAFDGSTGTGAGLVVRLEDGRAFLVEARTDANRLAVAKLVVAKQ